MDGSTQIARLIGFGLIAAFTGGTYHYAANGSRDFEVTVHRPADEVYSAFSGVMMISTGARDAGFVTPKVTVTRPSKNELVFTTPSANPGQISRIALTFEAGPDAASTTVTSAIDVPPIAMGGDDKGMYLSEDKVEKEFEHAIAVIGKRLDQGNSTTVAQYEFRRLLDIVALAANPEQAKAYLEQAKRRMADIDRAKARLEAQGYEVADPKEEYGAIRDERMEEASLD